MRVRQRILLYFSLVSVVGMAMALLVIHALFSEYREEEFQRRLQEKMTLTLGLLSTVSTDDQDVIETIDRQTINALFQEKLLLFDADKKLLYSGLDDTPVLYQSRILQHLAPDRPWIETNEEGFDVVGAYIEFQGRGYYGINKAYDTFGHSKLNYLRKVLIFTFLLYTLIVVAITYFLAGQIAAPITSMARQIAKLDLGSHGQRLPMTGKHREADELINQFNALMDRADSAFAFQRHAVHHISHELRTPIAVMVTSLDRMMRQDDAETLRLMARELRDDAKALGDIINAMLEIAKTESGQAIEMAEVRVDELLIDVVTDLRTIHPGFDLQIEFGNEITDEHSLTVWGNERLLRSVITNLANNCLYHGGEKGSHVRLGNDPEGLTVEFVNPGTPIGTDERPMLFKHFFRGANSSGRKGFGLGLVLVARIAQLHGGSISYHAPQENINVFRLTLPHRP